ncbi:hypothetical protein B0J18DRAFT_424887 [Chaetomium sp. MPI-SDFR-AT-0129]|nr:hypothetical protein B0J18DRAFT_424887 [Chaetomium sp. MPI-SDFR-AT-0129]
MTILSVGTQQVHVSQVISYHVLYLLVVFFFSFCLDTRHVRLEVTGSLAGSVLQFILGIYWLEQLVVADKS